ncbi:hypothetical protein FHR99_001795 [Litorivivens lipolytica]|uniref:DUF3301 domain-containing protein n=1 Tax=Litorivivens lipolytica TaxID=1524264 RepID=A0A7W4W512_9GAMM|nr:DUF3301 domain-containing protein [Litorivivens lipolytica]MBB3047529.1 hypothetical protein [Litorivivens lipolytica]
MISLSDIALLLLVVLLGYYFWQAQGVRDIALRATRLYCQRENLQLLDDSIALRALWVKRDPKGRFRLWRGYQFEFTVSGEERYVGRTVTLGRFIEGIQVSPHRMPDDDRTLH